jgi:hypothetical protein
MFERLSNSSKIALQLAFVAVLLALVVILLLSLGIMRPSAGSRRVEFRVEASGGVAVITLQAGEFSITKPTTVTSPWIKRLDIPSGTEVYLTGANPTQTGKLSCSITLDKVPWKSATNSAPKDGVACAGIVP